MVSLVTQANYLPEAGEFQLKKEMSSMDVYRFYVGTIFVGLGAVSTTYGTFKLGKAFWKMVKSEEDQSKDFEEGLFLQGLGIAQVAMGVNDVYRAMFC